MEEDRIGAMYLSLWLRRVSEIRNTLFPRGLLRSPLLPGTILAILILGPGIAWRMHRMGQFGRAKRELNREIQNGPEYNLAGQPGGMAPVVLVRSQTPETKAPEFLSTTFLPGLGMSVLQITAYLPGRGVTPLLESPTADQIVQDRVGAPKGANDDHGALELPWGGELMGGMTPLGTAITVNWRGQTIEQPTSGSAQPEAAEGGMLTTVSADHATSAPIPDGMQAQSEFLGVNEDDRWPSKTDVRVSAQMTAHAIDLTVQAKNTGDGPEPMGVGWHPRFQIVSGARDRVQLRLPTGDVMQIADSSNGRPSGTFKPATETRSIELGAAAIDETLAHLKPTPGSDGPSVEFRDPNAGFGIRMIASSPTIHALRITSPAEATYVSLGLQTNLDDPFGKEWTAPDDGGMVVLEAGQTLVWKVRLEIFSVPTP